jgi:hypothetical protein
MRDAGVMQGRAPTPLKPPGRRHACTGAVRSPRRCITQRCLSPRQQHTRHNTRKPFQRPGEQLIGARFVFCAPRADNLAPL